MKSVLIDLGLGLNRILRPLGLRLARHPCGADRRLRCLLQRERINSVIDIGANTGQFAHHLRELGYDGRILSVEPLSSAFEVLRSHAARDSQWEVVQRAVSDSSEPVRLHVARNSVSSSILPMAERHLRAAPESRTVAEVTVPTISLDELLAKEAGRNVFVKIDTQGFERQVLESGQRNASAIRMLELELSIVELYAGQALFRELDDLVLGMGFELASIAEGFFDEQSGELLQIDAVYVRRPTVPAVERESPASASAVSE